MIPAAFTSGLLASLLLLSGCGHFKSAATADPNQTQSAQTQTSPSPDYVIGPEDVLTISVWKDQELTRKLIVRPDGKLSFPLIGEVQAAGFTAARLQEDITKRLSEFVPDARVFVEVSEARSMKIYIVGKVTRPGEYIVGKQATVMQALSLAGGMTPFADSDDVSILRQVEGKQVSLPFDYGDVSRGKRLEQNITLQRGDVVVVP
jgi:polysaccharide export outer membrane protein